MVKWDKKIEDRHMKGNTPFGEVWIRFDREGKAIGLYTCFGDTQKWIPDEEWMQDLEGAQLRLEELTEDTKRLRDWGEGLRSKD